MFTNATDPAPHDGCCTALDLFVQQPTAPHHLIVARSEIANSVDDNPLGRANGVDRQVSSRVECCQTRVGDRGTRDAVHDRALINRHARLDELRLARRHRLIYDDRQLRCRARRTPQLDVDPLKIGYGTAGTTDQRPQHRATAPN